MLITAKANLGNKTRVIDFEGKKIPFLVSFDTVTKEAEIIITSIRDGNNSRFVVVADETSSEGSGRILTAKVLLPGCKAVDRETGEEIV